MLTTAIAVLLSAAPAAAQQPAVSTAPAAQVSTAAAAIPLPRAHSPALRRLMKDLNLLLERGGVVPPEKLDALAAEAGKLDAKVRDVLGAGILDEAAGREASELAAAAKRALAALRSDLQFYYAVNGGKYPASPSQLVPAQLQALPELELPGHAPTAAVTIIDSKKYDKDASEAVKDSGGWLYFAAPDSANYGLLLLDCSHRDPGGEEFDKY